MREIIGIGVDIQSDFLPGGALPVERGDEILDPANLILRHPRIWNVASHDWHPEDDPSFRENGGEWPAHCVQGTPGACWPGRLETEHFRAVFRKTGYSALSGTGLSELLDGYQQQTSGGIAAVLVYGLALDYCVKATALDCRDLGLPTYLAGDATAPVSPADSKGVLRELEAAGVIVDTTQNILRFYLK